MSMNHITSVRNSVMLLGLEAVLCAEHNDPNAVVRAIATAVSVAGSLDKEPMQMAHTVRMWSSVWGAWALEHALRHVQFTDGQLARLHRAFAAIQSDEGLRRAFAGNRCVWLTAFEQPASLDPHTFDPMPPVPVLEAFGALGLSAREGAVFLDYTQECMRVVGLSPFRRLVAIKDIEARYLRRGGTLLLWRVGGMSGAIRVETRAVAWLEVTATALAVERYRLARGKLPEELSQLVPDYLAAVPEDPFDGTPLRYRCTGRGFVIYSVGEDGNDDGGKAPPPAAHEYDVTFTMER